MNIKLNHKMIWIVFGFILYDACIAKTSMTLRGGASFSGFQLNEKYTDNPNQGLRIGYHIGMMSEIGPFFKNASILVGGGYESCGGIYKGYITYNGINTKVIMKFNYIKLPLMIKYGGKNPAGNNFSVSVGPYASYLLSSKIKPVDEFIDINGVTNIEADKFIDINGVTNFDIGISFLLQYEANKMKNGVSFIFYAGYDLGLINTIEKPINDDYAKNICMRLGAGLKF